ncbi:MAG: peptide chain release factor 1 [Oscillospiraceae bacterium]|nr:peptide chain release factor 1 [Oscillospiraceae bacterium]
MADAVAALQARYAQLQAQLDAPETYADPALCARLNRERKALEPLLGAYERREALLLRQSEAKALLADPELGELARAELDETEAALAETAQELRRLRLPPDEHDGRAVILELRAGTGGEEAALFAAALWRMYSLYAARRGWQTRLLSVSDTELGGLRELVCEVRGEDAWRRLRFEAGAHCVKRVPVTESSGRIQTSTATVAVLPEVGETELSIPPEDLRIDTFRASGAGGQKVNKTESAIRVTHLPTGTVVECQDERSQYQNKDRALAILRARLSARQRQARADARDEARRSQVGTGSRSEKIRTYFYLRDQVVDQRLHGENRTFRLGPILDGALEELSERLLDQEQAARLEERKDR